MWQRYGVLPMIHTDYISNLCRTTSRNTQATGKRADSAFMYIRGHMETRWYDSVCVAGSLLVSLVPAWPRALDPGEL